MLDDVEDDDIVNQNSSRGEQSDSNSEESDEEQKEVEHNEEVAAAVEDASTLQAKIIAERIRHMRQGGLVHTEEIKESALTRERRQSGKESNSSRSSRKRK